MTINKTEILKKICYTELVYERINKKLNTNYSKKQIESFISKVLKETDTDFFNKKGKNYYFKCFEHNAILTINSHSLTVITAKQIDNK